jgi:hypothetical protein
MRTYGYNHFRKYDGTEIAELPTYHNTKINNLDMAKQKFTTTLDESLIKEIKKLAIDLGRSANDLIEEGLRFVLKKYRREASRK